MITKKGGHPRFYELVELMESTHEKKNSDYATKADPLSNLRSSEQFFDIPPYIGVAIRLSDKWCRFCELIKKDFNNSVAGESVSDTLLDMANYALLEIILIEEQIKSSKKK
jgi:hypothetical protein